MPSSVSSTNEKDQKKRKRKLRRELWLLLRRLRKACERFNQVDQWLEYAQETLDLADRYADVLSEADRQRLQEAVELKERSLAGVRAACQVLQLEIERLIAMLPAATGSALLAPALKVLLGVAVVVGLVVGVANAVRPATVRLVNGQCGPIPIAEGMSPTLVRIAQSAGIHLPNRLEDGETGEIRLPSFLPTLTLDATQPPTLWLKAAFVSIPLETSNSLEEIFINGQPYLGDKVDITLTAGEEINVEVQCR